MPRNGKSGPSLRQPVSIDHEGTIYHGEYVVEGRPPLVYVFYRGRREATQQGGLPSDIAAGHVLSAMVAKYR